MSWKPTIEECQSVLETLVKVNTCQPEGNEGKLVDTILEMVPQDIEKIRIEHTPGRASLILKVDGETKQGGLAFVGHIDTVACSDLDQWIYPPHEAAVKDGILYGRGSSDMKGGDTSMLLVLKRLLESGKTPKKPIYFCFTADEENKGAGVLALIEGHYLDDVDEVFVCEPSAEKISICEKGAIWFRLNAHGIPSHGSRPDLGVNAVEYAYDFAEKIKAYIGAHPTHPIMGTASASVTKFQGGNMTNIIPSSATLEMDVRTVPGISHEELEETARKICKELMDQAPGLELQVEVINNRPAVETASDHPFVTALQKIAGDLGMSTQLRGHHFYTDASQLIPAVPMPFVIAGPGDDAMAHCLNEKIELASVARFAALYNEYIEEYYL